jgi:hypothetical protein
MLNTAAQRLGMSEQVLSSAAVVAAYLNRIKATAGTVLGVRQDFAIGH